MKRLLQKGLLLCVAVMVLSMCESGNTKKYKTPSEEDLFQLRKLMTGNDLQGIRNYFAEGYNPNISKGVTGWSSDNPLWLVCGGGGTLSGKDGIVSGNNDMLKVLLEAGADTTLRPYIWHGLFTGVLTEEDFAWLSDLTGIDQKAKNRITLESMYERLLLLIEYGADVDKKGAPNRLLFPSNDLTYQLYFMKEGSRPIDLAIEKNLPTIVDLLLAHSKIGLTEKSLQAAERSNDPAMVEKVQKLWEEQEENP